MRFCVFFLLALPIRLIQTAFMLIFLALIAATDFCEYVEMNAHVKPKTTKTYRIRYSGREVTEKYVPFELSLQLIEVILNVWR